MDSNFMTIIMQLLKNLNEGSNSDSMRSLIQEELKKTQNEEKNHALNQMLKIIEEKHAAELQEASREKDMYKIQAELYKKQLQELSREKKFEDKTERMKELLNHLAELNIKKPEHQFKPNPKQDYYDKTNHSSKNFQKGKGANCEGTLPWMDNPKGNFTTKTKDLKQPNQSFYPKSGDHFKKNINHNDGQNAHSNRGHHYSNRGGENRGRGQRGFNHRGRGRSASLGRNQYAAQQDNASGTSNTGGPQATTSFHVQVTKNIGEQWQWVSNENLTGATQQQHGGQGHVQGRGKARGRGNGRGRGQGQANSQTHGNQQKNVNKNRQKTQSGKQNEESDDCLIS